MGKLTVAFVRAVDTPGKYYDQHGLLLRVAPGGSKQWIWRGTIRGRRRDVGLGAVAYTTLAEARDIAYQYRKLARAGDDPRPLKSDDIVPAFAEAVEQVIEVHRPGWKRTGRSEENWRSSLERYAYPALGSTPVDQITSADLVRVLLPIWHSRPETARKLKTRLGVVMRWSIAAGHRADDPAGPTLAAALPRHTAPTKHLASLPHAEVAAALATLDASSRAWRAHRRVPEVPRGHRCPLRRGPVRHMGRNRPRHPNLGSAGPAHQDQPGACGAVVRSGARRARRGPPLLRRLRAGVLLAGRPGAE